MEKYTTRELVEEIQKREDVEVIIAEPHKTETISVEGPAIILKIIDMLKNPKKTTRRHRSLYGNFGRDDKDIVITIVHKENTSKEAHQNLHQILQRCCEKREENGLCDDEFL